ncbi:methyltransferase domain-containing protein [Bacillus sp. NTK074B]|uniref:class I SAM-dependent methyltransferase n=1 Tax=Bacillus sp. NTK074B TaxID=2802174 RepID=UPI001A9001AB|nr:methyltransferase domain-containing protein [Bacillus sp. NTK074B]
MKKPLDRISEAYHDELGTKFGKKVRDRVHWMGNKVVGEKVLDVGCSQGIFGIILGRVGKQVLGIDILQESIDYANETLSKEEESTKRLVNFQVINFITHDFEGEEFDTIVFGEVLEHVTNPNEFIEKAESLLTEDGRIIVTVPFGINDYFDHKKTYYLSGLYELINESLYITEVEFFGKWIAIVLDKQKKDVEDFSLNMGMLQKLEQAFEKIERESIKSDKKLKKKIEQLETENEELKNQQENETLKLIKENNTLIHEFKISLLSEEKKFNLSVVEDDQDESLMKAMRALADEKKDKIAVQEQLVKAYQSEEQALASYRKLHKKYRALSSSKFGKITLKYWNIKKKMKKEK